MPTKRPVAKSKSAPASNPNGSPKTFSLISDSKLRQLYAVMLKCRILDQRLRAISAKGPFRGGYLSSFGHEAAIVGAAIDLRREDWIVPPASIATASFVKGSPLAELLAQLRAKPTDPPLDPHRERLHILPAGGAQPGIAIGAALTIPRKSDNSVVMAFSENGIGQGQEALNFAALHRLPIVIVEFGKATSWRKTRNAIPSECAVPVIPVDGRDAVAMYRVACESIHKARHGGGPTVIQATTREPAGKDGKGEADPVARMERYLAGKGLFTPAWKQNVADKFAGEVSQSIEAPGKR